MDKSGIHLGPRWSGVGNIAAEEVEAPASRVLNLGLISPDTCACLLFFLLS
jgi:hypothetical protein